MWQLRFDNGLTSAGILFEASRVLPGATPTPLDLWNRTLTRYPGLLEQFRHARPIRPWQQWPACQRLQRRAGRTAGPDWAMLAPAAYSLDALYSTGNAHALHTVQRLARLFRTKGLPDLEREMRDYDLALQREMEFLDRLVFGTYRAMRHFGLLASFAMYYFAGAISAEERRRRGEADPDEEFLSSHIPAFRAAVFRGCDEVDALAREAKPDAEAFQRRVAEDIAPWNTVGLCQASKRNLYPYG